MDFPLAGLLRIRDAQERQAAESLSRANADVARAEDAERTAIAALADLHGEIDDPATLMAMAAARAAGRSALGDLQALLELRRGEAAQAKSAHVEARREVKGLERLESAHRTANARTQQRAEQGAIDEIAVMRATRISGGAA